LSDTPWIINRREHSVRELLDWVKQFQQQRARRVAGD